MSLDRDLFRRELAGWTGRGGLCAAPSFFWAVIADFRHPVEIGAMVLVTALYVAGYAWLSGWEVMAATPRRRQFVRALKMSAWIKPAAVVVLGGACALLSGRVLNAETWFAGMAPDLGGGLGSVLLVSWLVGVRDLGVGRLDSFGWTALTTAVQGALISGLLAAMALGILVWWQTWAWLKPRLQISPARIAS